MHSLEFTPIDSERLYPTWNLHDSDFARLGVCPHRTSKSDEIDLDGNSWIGYLLKDLVAGQYLGSKDFVADSLGMKSQKSLWATLNCTQESFVDPMKNRLFRAGRVSIEDVKLERFGWRLEDFSGRVHPAFRSNPIRWSIGAIRALLSFILRNYALFGALPRSRRFGAKYALLEAMLELLADICSLSNPFVPSICGIVYLYISLLYYARLLRSQPNPSPRPSLSPVHPASRTINGMVRTVFGR